MTVITKDFSAKTFATYQAGVKEIVSRIEAIGAKPIAMSPTLFDHHQLANEWPTIRTTGSGPVPSQAPTMP